LGGLLIEVRMLSYGIKHYKKLPMSVIIKKFLKKVAASSEQKLIRKGMFLRAGEFPLIQAKGIIMLSVRRE